jgi:hypothetical protein
MQQGLSHQPDSSPKLILYWGNVTSSTSIRISEDQIGSSWATHPRYVDPTEGMSADEKRAYRRLQDRWVFESFIESRMAELREGRSKIRTPYTQADRAFGTCNGLRPTPMLC